MATAENRKRKRDRKPKQEDSPWGSLLFDVENSPSATMPPPPAAYEDASLPTPPEESAPGVWRRLWHLFSFWALMATLLFLAFTGSLAWLVVQMWTPQDMRDIAGYTDKGAAKDLLVALRNANGAEIIFTEGELNRYLRDTCRLRQTGIFSIIAHAQGVAVRIHEGYAELIIDRVLSTHFHQTTAVNLTFERQMEHGHTKLHIEFRGGPPLLGSLPCGGRIGRIGIPQRFIRVLHPALDTLQDCYPDIVDIIETAGYHPTFHSGKDGREGYVRLTPYTPASSL